MKGSWRLCLEGERKIGSVGGGKGGGEGRERVEQGGGKLEKEKKGKGTVKRLVCLLRYLLVAGKPFCHNYV